MSRLQTILAVATEWASHHGGLSTINRAVCTALANAGHDVFCLIPKATRDEVEYVKNECGVTLLQPKIVGADLPAMLFRTVQLPTGITPDVIIGHGRITGPAAKVHHEDSFPRARRIHFIHMAPTDTEWFKGRENAAARAEDRELQESRLCQGADLIVAIGPRLHRAVSSMLVSQSASTIWQLDPALPPESSVREPPPGLRILVMGRAEEDDFKLKGLDIAARAVGLLAERNFETPLHLVVRGAQAGTADILRDKLVSIAQSSAEVEVRLFSTDAERLLDDFFRASLVIAPSRAEGFGLVGLEAIAARVPVLVSDKSGLGEMICTRLPPAESASFVVKVTNDLQADALRWAEAIECVLRDRRAAIARVDKLARRIAAHSNWDSIATHMLAQLRSRSDDEITAETLHSNEGPTEPPSVGPSPRERLATAVREPDVTRARGVLNELANSKSNDVESNIVAATALEILADLEDHGDQRLTLRRRAITTSSKSWRRIHEPALALCWADTVVNHFYDRLAQEESALRDKALRDAKKGLDEAITSVSSVSDSRLRAELLGRKASVLGCQALAESSFSHKRLRVEERQRCAELAVKQSSTNPQALLALGQAKWMAARWEKNDQRYVELLNDAENALRRTGCRYPVSQLVLCRFLRQTHRPFQAIREFVRYWSIEPNRWRRLAEAHLIGESALVLLMQGFDFEVIGLAAKYAREYLQEAVQEGTGTARTYIALANACALLGLTPDAGMHLSQLKRGGKTEWLTVLHDAMKSIEKGVTVELTSAFVLGLDDAAIWNQLGAFVRRFVGDLDLARLIWETGLKLDRSNPELLTNLARILILTESDDDVITASDYIDRAARKADRTWRWWQPVRRDVEQARSRLGLPSLPVLRSMGGQWNAAQTALQVLRTTGAGARTLLEVLISMAPGVQLAGDLMQNGSVLLRLDMSEDCIRLCDVGDESAQMGADEMAAVVDGQLGLSSLIDRLTARWPVCALSPVH